MTGGKMRTVLERIGRLATAGQALPPAIPTRVIELTREVLRCQWLTGFTMALGAAILGIVALGAVTDKMLVSLEPRVAAADKVPAAAPEPQLGPDRHLPLK